MAYGNNNYGNNQYGNNYGRQGGGFDRGNSYNRGGQGGNSNYGNRPNNYKGNGNGFQKQGGYNKGGYQKRGDQPYVLESGKGKAFPRERSRGEKVGRPTHTGNINLKEDKFILDLISENGGVLPISIWVNEQTGVISLSIQTTQEKLQAIQDWEEREGIESQERKSIGGNTADNRSFNLLADLSSVLENPVANNKNPVQRNVPQPPNARQELVEDHPPFEPTDELPKKVPARGGKKQ